MRLVGKDQQRNGQMFSMNAGWGGGLTLQLLSKHGEEDGEVDGAAGLLDHGLQLLILHIQLA